MKRRKTRRGITMTTRGASSSVDYQMDADRALDALVPDLRIKVDAILNDTLQPALKKWPVQTGRSKAAFEMERAAFNSKLQVEGKIYNNAVNPVDTTRRAYAYLIRPKWLNRKGKSSTVWTEFLRNPFRKKFKALKKEIVTAIINNPKLRGGR